MKRIRIGDVFYTRTPNGCKLFQWAYSDHVRGHAIRVFDGLYDEIPDDIGRIVKGPHSYITTLDIRKAYRTGLAQLIGNQPIPPEYPYPEYAVSFYRDDSGKIYQFRLMSTVGNENLWFSAGNMAGLPCEYRNEKLLNLMVSPAWMLYLFDVGFDMNNLERFYPCEPGGSVEASLEKYINIVDSYIDI